MKKVTVTLLGPPDGVRGAYVQESAYAGVSLCWVPAYSGCRSTGVSGLGRTQSRTHDLNEISNPRNLCHKSSSNFLVREVGGKRDIRCGFNSYYLRLTSRLPKLR